MGGRGTFAIGNIVPYSYKTIGKIGNHKIVEGINGKHGLPEESHTSSSYVKVYDNGKVKQIRLYNKDHTTRTDIEYSVHQGKKFLHAHDYSNGKRSKARDLTIVERKKYNKLFGG